MLDWIYDPTAWSTLLALTSLEIILGIDNIVFISVVSQSLPSEQRDYARRLGLGLALTMRLILLSLLFWIAHLQTKLFTAFGHDFSWRDIILVSGGTFLIWKAALEIHKTTSPHHSNSLKMAGKVATLGAVLWQIAIIDMVFSIDSIITAIGLAHHLPVMVLAVLIAMGFMYAVTGSVTRFIERYPSTKILALAFLVMIGFALVCDGLGQHIERGYLYAAMAFASFVEGINILADRNKGAK